MTAPKDPMQSLTMPSDIAKAGPLSDEELDCVAAGLKTNDLLQSTTDSLERTMGVAGTASGGGSR